MRREPKFTDIVHYVEDRIRGGQFKIGDKLPSVNSFHIQFSLSRSSVFLAMNDLQERGIIEAQPAVGYFVKSDNISVREKILLMFNEMSSFKEDLYKSLVESLGDEASVDIEFHYFDRRVFETLLKEANGNYTSYVLMPGKFDGLAPLLKTIRGKVFLLDHYQNDLIGLYPAVGQNFEADTYDALLSKHAQVQKYNNLILIQSESKEPSERYDGIKRFCDEFGLTSLLLPTVKDWPLHRDTLYITPSDRELANIVRKALEEKLEIGKDIGIISYNDTPIKEVLAGGIATISTDFKQMGRTMAELITSGGRTNPAPAIRNPWMLIPRNSL